MPKSGKYLNRNPFTEKLIHRYYFEKMYTEKSGKWKKLLPDYLKIKRKDSFNLLVPEFGYSGYTADFAIFFKDEQEGIPIEIKWRSSKLTGKNQINALKSRNGFLVSFDDDYQQGIPIVKINESNFREWLLDRVEFLWEDAFKKEVESSSDKKYWIVVLRGKGAEANWQNMKQDCSKNALQYWAHKTSPQVMTNLLELTEGDEMVFLFLKTTGTPSSKMSLADKSPLQINNAVITEVKNPYYMRLDETVFEKEQNPTLKKWAHFFDFREIKEYKDTTILYPNKTPPELYPKIVESSNKGGILWQITSSEIKYIKSQLRKQEINNL